AGANALELNAYLIATNCQQTAADVEKKLIDVVTSVREASSLPLAVKLAPTFSSLPNLASKIEAAGAQALVLFNRVCEPDIDVHKMQIVPNLRLSDSSELPLRLRWLTILSRQTCLN